MPIRMRGPNFRTRIRHDGETLVRREVLTGAEEWFRRQVASALEVPLPPHPIYSQTLIELVAEFSAAVQAAVREPFDLPLNSTLELFGSLKRASGAVKRNEIFGVKSDAGRLRIRSTSEDSDTSGAVRGRQEPLLRRDTLDRTIAALHGRLDHESNSRFAPEFGVVEFFQQLRDNLQIQVRHALEAPFRLPLVHPGMTSTKKRRLRNLAASGEIAKAYKAGTVWYVPTPLYTAHAHDE
ncbi:MAG: hypothetical protein ACYC7F_11715 [Gemmatimonadaceae bacterium]